MGFRPAGSMLQLDLRSLDDALPVLLWPRGLIAVAPGGGPRHLQASSSPPPLPTTRRFAGYFVSCLLARHFAGRFFVMSFGPSFCRPFLCHVFWPSSFCRPFLCHVFWPSSVCRPFLCHVFWPVVLPAFCPTTPKFQLYYMCPPPFSPFPSSHFLYRKFREFL